VKAWRELCGLELEGRDVWVHEAGWTPFSGFAIYLLTGKGGALTNVEASMQDRYLARALDGAWSCGWPEGSVPRQRRERLDALRSSYGARAALDRLGCALHEEVLPGRIPLAAGSMDLVHSGGALEHYREEELTTFLEECRRVLKPGGVASHVFDHRDHLFHADKGWPYLAHYAWPAPAYTLLFGHELMHHNRLPPEEIGRRFEAAGFERIALRRMVLGAGYVSDEEALAAVPGVDRRWLPRSRADISELDLRTAAAHYLFRKPG